MSPGHVFSLDAVRTDGWFERIGEGIGSFQALCEIVGERFFAFSMIIGARITALTVDRRNPDNTLVDFVVGVSGPTADAEDRSASRSPISAVASSARSSPTSGRAVAAPARDRPRGDPALHRRALPAARAALRLQPAQARGRPTTEPSSRSFTTASTRSTSSTTFRMRIRAHVRDELDRVASGKPRRDRSPGGSPRPKQRRWRQTTTRCFSCSAHGLRRSRSSCARPKGRCSSPEPRALIAKGLGLLGSSCV